MLNFIQGFFKYILASVIVLALVGLYMFSLGNDAIGWMLKIVLMLLMAGLIILLIIIV